MGERSLNSHRATIRAMRPFRTILRNFASDTRGSVVVQMLIFSLLIFAMAGLVISMGRLYVTNTAAQAYVDQIALAAAYELDNKSDSIERARRAAFGATENPANPDGILKKRTPFGFGVEDLIEVEELIFLSDLPRDQGYQYEVRDLPPNFTVVSEEANYVAVVARPISFLSVLLPVYDWVGLGGGILSTRAVAVATLEDGGFCENPMFMFCNPREADGPLSEIPGGVRGRQMLGKAHNGGSELWVAGNFGYLKLPVDIGANCADNDGAAAMGCKMAANSLIRACDPNGVDMRTGQAIASHRGLNVRFGIFDGNKYRDEDYISPDVNVIKGWGYDESPPNNQSCRDNDFVKPDDDPPYTDSVTLPRDPCFFDSSCPVTRVSDAVTQDELRGYWNQNHPLDDFDSLGTDIDGIPTFLGIDDPYFDGPLTMDTRYNLYYYEIAANMLTGVGTGAILESGDPSNPVAQCTDAPPLVDRRVFAIASVNCNEHNVRGGATDVPVDEYFWVFLTEPVVNNGYNDPNCNDDSLEGGGGGGGNNGGGGGNNGGGGGGANCSGAKNDDDIYVEFIRQITADEDPEILHEFPVLNR